jgi:hypothetical protein
MKAEGNGIMNLPDFATLHERLRRLKMQNDEMVRIDEGMSWRLRQGCRNDGFV